MKGIVLSDGAGTRRYMLVMEKSKQLLDVVIEIVSFKCVFIQGFWFGGEP